jgi:plastocyanin
VRCLAVAGALLLAGAAGSAPVPERLEVTMPGKAFAPGETDVLLGTSVVWRNTDSSTHTVTADDDTFDSGDLRPGREFALSFSKTGVFAYHCTIHRFMRGEVRVYALVLRGPERPVLAGFATRLEGRAPPGSTEVVLERITRSASAPLRRATPLPDGTFAFALRVGTPAAYRVRIADASSPVVPIPVAPHVSLVRDGGSLKVRALPARSGSPVAIQAYERERFAWVTVARGRLGRTSTASIRLDAGLGAHLRAVVRGRGGWSDGVSPVVVVRSPS